MLPAKSLYHVRSIAMGLKPFRWFAILLIALALSHAAYTQSGKVPLLERTITLNLQQERLDVALKKIAQAGGFTFSYNTRLIDVNRVVTFTFSQKTVREILDEIFKGEIQYRIRNRYIILAKAETSHVAREPTLISGYVVDEATGQRLKNVSVYDPESLSSAITDSYGFFQIEIPKPTGEEIKLAINKRSYTDTLVVVPSQNPRLLNIPIRFNTEKISAVTDSVGKKLKRLWLNTKHATVQAVNMENITDTLYRKFQFSVIPFVGTNGKLSGNVINDYSLNLFGGYSLGTQKFEMGGLFNTVRGNVSGAQVAGLFNVTAGKHEGAQLAGLANANWSSSQGFGAAGLFNFTNGTSTGAMLSGIGNFTIGNQEGVHVGGFFNFSAAESQWAQISGVVNFTGKNMLGAQVAGVLNVVGKDARGTQVAGVVNLAAHSINGTQAAGVLNVAKHVKGTQIGLINVSDSIKGVPIGLLSIVGKGYHKIEVSADEIFYTNLSFRTGVRQFYNILLAGAKPNTFKDDETTWTFGYGIGTAPKITKRLSLNFDLTSQQVVNGNAIEAVNLINKLYVGFDVQTSRWFSVIAGLTLNGHVTESSYENYPDLFTDYQPYVFNERTFSNGRTLKMWLGGKVGVRIL